MGDCAFYEEVLNLTRSGEAFALATVIDCNGSSPRKAGAKMIVRMDETTLGTVGGGRVEAETIRAALESLAEGTPRTLTFVLNEENGYVCGGRMTIYVEPHGDAPRLVMFGGGHVGKAVGRLAKTCGFRVTMVDERPEFADRQALPFADEIICSTAEEAFGRLRVTDTTFIVIATTGHELDFQAVRCALRTTAGFIGLLGSNRKREVLMRSLEEEGVSESAQQRIATPVGLDIGAESPEEIAVSIVGQLIRKRRDHAATRSRAPACSRTLATDGSMQTAPSP